MTPLPPLQRQNQVWAWLFALMGFLTLILVGLWLDNDILIGVSVAFSGISLLFVILIASMLRLQRKSLRALVNGDCVARWTFSTQEWEAHIVRSLKRQKSTLLRYAVIGLVMGGLLAAMIIGVFLYEKKGVALYWVEICSMAGGLFTVCILCGIGWDCYERKRVKAWRSCSQIYIGRPGLYIGGELWPRRPSFKDIRFENVPHPVLLFDFEVRVKNGSYIEQVPVPVPVGEVAGVENILDWVKREW